jgi:hypothetical protein
MWERRASGRRLYLEKVMDRIETFCENASWAAQSLLRGLRVKGKSSLKTAS